MPTFGERLKRWFGGGEAIPTAPPLVAPGLYTHTFDGGAHELRHQLRVDGGGAGTWLLQGRRVASLAPPEAAIAHGVLVGEGDEAIIARLDGKLGEAEQGQLRDDLQRLRPLLDELLAGRAAPSELAAAVRRRDDDPLSAPLGADLDAAPEATLAPLLDRLAALHVPRVTIWDRPDADPDWSIAAVRRATEAGLAARVRASGTRVRARGVLGGLADAGLVCLQLPFAASAALLHDGVWGSGGYVANRFAAERARQRGIDVAVELPLVETAARELERIVEFTGDLDASTLGLWALVDERAPRGPAPPEDTADEVSFGDLQDTVTDPAPPLPLALPAAAMAATVASIDAAVEGAPFPVRWLGTTRARVDGSLADQLRRGPRCSGGATIRVTLDGQVLPPHGGAAAAGHLLDDRWETVWRAPAFARWRDGAEAARCDACSGGPICADGCLLDTERWSGTDARG